YQIDKNQPISNWRTMESMLSDSMARRRFTMQLLSAFAGIAILLAVVGLYGLMAYTLSIRNREIGIRAALGARARTVLWMVFVQGMKLALIGVVVGLALAAALSHWIASQLFQVRPFDPLLYAA